jgi:hypothetical protein
MTTLTSPPRLLSRDETRRRVAHPLERLRGYIRTYVAAEGLAVLVLGLALLFWLGLLVDYGIFKAFAVDWVQELSHSLRAWLLGMLYVAALVVIQLIRMIGQENRAGEPGPVKTARWLLGALGILVIGAAMRPARARWPILLLVLPAVALYLAGWFLVGYWVDQRIIGELITGCLVTVLLLAPVVGMVVNRLVTSFHAPALALVLERRFPGLLGDRLITAVEMDDPELARSLGYSPTMLEQTIQEAALLVDQIPLGEVFNWKRLRLHALAVVLVTLGLYVVCGFGYCAFNQPAGVSDFVADFNEVTLIWLQRNFLLLDTIWPRRAQLELLDFPGQEIKIGRDSPPPTLRVRALKWVIADPDRARAPEGWRALEWDDLSKHPELVGGMEVPTIEGTGKPPNWRGTVDEIDFYLQGEAGKQPAAEPYLAVLARLEEQVASAHLSRRLRKLMIPQMVTVYSKGATSKNEQMFPRQSDNEYSGTLADLKESIRFTIRGEDYYTASRRIILVPPPTIVRLVRDEDQPAYLYYRVPSGASPAALKGKKQKLRDQEVSLTGESSRFEVPAGTDVVLTAQTDKKLKPDRVRFLPPRKGMAEVKVPIEQPDDQTFRVRFANVTTPIDFLFEFTDTDNVPGSRHIAIKPMEDQAPDVDVQVEVMRKTNQGFIITPSALIPFSGKVRDDRGLSSVEFAYTVTRMETEAEAKARGIFGAGLLPHLLTGIPAQRATAAAVLSWVTKPGTPGGALGSDDEDKKSQKIPLPAFAKLLAERGVETLPLPTLLERLEQEPPHRTVVDRKMLRDFPVDPDDEESKFNVAGLNLKVTDEKASQPHYRLRLWLLATDTNLDTGPRVGQSKEKFTFIVVSENELLVEIAKEEEGLHLKMEEAVNRLKDGRVKLDRVRKELPELKPEEFSSQATQIARIEENVDKSWDAAREVYSDYKRILKELRANRVQPGMINKVNDKIVEPLDAAINQDFVRTQESLRDYEKTLAAKKLDLKAADQARAELDKLIDRLEGVLNAMSDVLTIADLIKRLSAIDKAEQDEIQRLKELIRKKEEELINPDLEPNKK